jgi:hypothetical protein
MEMWLNQYFLMKQLCKMQLKQDIIRIEENSVSRTRMIRNCQEGIERSKDYGRWRDYQCKKSAIQRDSNRMCEDITKHSSV